VSPAARQLLLPPLAIVLVLVGLYFWVDGQELDRIAVNALAGEDADSAHAYSHNVLVAIGEHLRLVGISAVIVLLIGIPIGILVTRPGARGLAPVVSALANAGQAAPVIGILVLAVAVFGLKSWVPYLALVVYSVLPVMRNTVEGVRAVDPALIDAARGQGLSRMQVLRRVELPLAVPVILAGVRTALILLVGTATLATFVDGGGLGDIINDGIKNQRIPVMIDGAVLAATLAVTIDWIAGIAERYLAPRGLRQEAGA